MIRIVAAFLFGLQAAMPAAFATEPEPGGSAADAVRALYVPMIWNPLEVESFSGVTEPALSILIANKSKSSASGESGCIDFVPTIDGEDYDDEEIGKTLKVSDLGPGSEVNSRTVSAKFTLFKEPREVFWTMQRDGRVWKIADVESRVSKWRLSQIVCTK